MDLRQRSYFGDGMWSAGKRLKDSAIIGASPMSNEEWVENIVSPFLSSLDLVINLAFDEHDRHQCGGAQTSSKSTVLRRRRARPKLPGPSNQTGPQAAKKRKAGSRITHPDAFGGPDAANTGRTLNEDIRDEAEKKKGTGFHKQANR